MANVNTSLSNGQFANLTKVFVAVLICGFVFSDFAFAQQLTEVKGRLQALESALSGLSLVTVTIAILYVGYKVLFGGATFKEMMPTIIGAIVIACAAQIAGLFINNP